MDVVVFLRPLVLIIYVSLNSFSLYLTSTFCCKAGKTSPFLSDCLPEVGSVTWNGGEGGELWWHNIAAVSLNHTEQKKYSGNFFFKSKVNSDDELVTSSSGIQVDSVCWMMAIEWSDPRICVRNLTVFVPNMLWARGYCLLTWARARLRVTFGC